MNFTKNLGKFGRPFLVFLASAALFPPFAIIPENKSEAVGRKSLFLRLQLAIRKSSENIDP